ncbi:anti-sigma factor RsbA family regulatory protein [Spirillospora sp. CA-294931]|uniref:anti-sigma factor RsbA family regulatory protein n=1 Tax=Spirillospora sp. CA-294931 TaxID=3240042 RepID=UPI003D8B97B1
MNARGGTSLTTLNGRDVLAHQALLYGSSRELAAVAVPYLREGVLNDEAAIAVVPESRAGTLRRQLGAQAARRVEFIDASEWFSGPMRSLAGYLDRARTDWWPRGWLRLLAEPEWRGRTPLEVCEWKRHEALLNVAFAGTPTTILCAYDRSTLPAHVLADAARTHPELVDDRGPRPSGQFTDPADFYAECNAGPLPAAPADAAARAFASGELPMIRTFLTREAARHGLPHDRSLPFVLAANEVATTIIREGGGKGSLWVWAEPGELLCDLHDPRLRMEDAFLGCLPPRGNRRIEAAMWAVRRLCHIVEIRSGAEGTLIRMHVTLP